MQVLIKADTDSSAFPFELRNCTVALANSEFFGFSLVLGGFHRDFVENPPDLSEIP